MTTNKSPLLIFDKDRKTKNIEFPSYFLRKQEKNEWWDQNGVKHITWGESKGIPQNKGIEGLSSTASGDTLFAIPENPLSQENRDKNNKKPLRFVKFHKNKYGIYKTVGEYFYKINTESGNGVSDILAVDGNRFIVVERSKHLTTRLF